MATTKQTRTAKRNVKKAQTAARRARTRRGAPGSALEDRNREQIYEVAKKMNIPGRSKMGKWELIKAIRKAG